MRLAVGVVDEGGRWDHGYLAPLFRAESERGQSDRLAMDQIAELFRCFPQFVG